jgi:Tol biopolymer transport system component
MIRARAIRMLIGASMLALIATGCAITRVSVSSNGTEGNQASNASSVTDDGRYSLVSSDASNLVPGDTNNATDFFRHDTKTGETVRADVANDGSQLPGGVISADMSSDGRYVAFLTAAALDPADTNGVSDVYVRDLTAGTTTWASQVPPGTQVYGGASYPAISTGGRFVSFLWSTPGSFPPISSETLYRRDRQLGTTTALSTNTYTYYEASKDLRHFTLTLSCQRLCTSGPVLIDTDGSGAGWPGLPFQNCAFDSAGPISATGRYLVFRADGTFAAPCLLPGVYVVDRATATATPIAGATEILGISEDGNTVLMLGPGNLVADGSDGQTDLFVHDMTAGSTRRFASSTSGGEPDANVLGGVLSDEGHEIAFTSAADDLVDHDTNGVADAFVRPGAVRPKS